MYWMIAEGSIRFPELGLDLGPIPEGINIFGISISFYGILLAFAMLAGLMLTEYLAKHSGQDTEFYLEFAIRAIIFGIVGARTGYVLLHLAEFKENPMRVFTLNHGGMVFYGALLFVLAEAFSYCHKHKYSMLQLCDTMAAGVVLGQIIGRFGDFFNRGMIGTHSDGLLAMQLEAGDVDPALFQNPSVFVPKQMLLSVWPSLQVHPLFLYEILWNIVLFVVLLVAFRKKKFDGEVFFFYLIGYGTIYFLLDFIRADAMTIASSFITAGQVFSFVMVAGAVVMLVRRSSENRKKERGKK